MANDVYTKGKNRILTAQINFATDPFKVALVGIGYAPSLDVHEFLSDLGANTIGTNQTLANKVVANGTFDADDPVWASIAAGSTAKALVIYKDTGVAGTSPLIFYIDEVTGFPLSTNGGDISPQFDNGPLKIYSL
ncbi:hypothetical protein IB236_13150 [Acidovorax sp. ACV02]|uniref:hypothetical protein n=1 Tax=Acidovorax sp. ACV02 TaxID=2769310 RepID=UPI0017840A05|nr:hypothetical protein [Acidovorax sp. ACV02]MBD9406289.1 hypothetical protein [Acidovorax sp. ACV02]